MRLDRQPQPGHRRDMAGMSGDGKPHLRRADRAARGLDADDTIALAQDAGDLAILDDVDAARIGGASVAPGDGIVPRRAAARLQ